MSIDLDRLAADMAATTGQTVEKVRASLEALGPDDSRKMAQALGITVPDGIKRGRPEDGLLIELRRGYPEASRRTIARHARALRLLGWAEVSHDDAVQLVETYTRPSGRLNVAGFERHAERMMFVRLVELRNAE